MAAPRRGIKGPRDREGGGEIKWNFTKFLIGRDGEVIKRFAPATTPAQIDAEIEALL